MPALPMQSSSSLHRLAEYRLKEFANLLQRPIRVATTRFALLMHIRIVETEAPPAWLVKTEAGGRHEYHFTHPAVVGGEMGEPEQERGRMFGQLMVDNIPWVFSDGFECQLRWTPSVGPE